MDDRQESRITNVNLGETMRKSFLEYAMSVIVARALPDVRDGLKPVQRRILYGMNELGVTPDKPYKKSARIVGDVMGKYHPHGDSSIYEGLVRMAQDFSYRYMLVDGHGNFGSVDGDGAAAMRYTEARMSKIAVEMLRDINKDTIDFQDNYDGTEKEPVVLPARFPNLLVNGATGIAVGMTTNIPPHNLSETISALHVLMDNPDATTADLMQALPGPDFPTGGVVMGKSGIRHAYETGRGTIVLRGKVDVQTEKSGRERIVITEIPYMVNKAKMVERIADLVHEKKIDGIVTLRDESDRDGMRIVIDVRRDASASVILNNLYKLTPLQTGFSFNMVAIVNGAPKVLSLKQILQYYLDHQENVIRRRTQFDLRKANAREHILEGLRIALDHIDEIITIIRSSETGDKAKVILMDKFKLSDKQSQAILDMRLVRLTGLEREKVESEYKDVEAAIADYTDILARPERVHQIIYNELLDIQKKFGDKRRTELLVGEVLSLEDEDLIEQEDVVITLSHNGYVKRLATSEFKAQNRGGRGIQGMNVHDDDFVERLISTSTHDVLLFFTNKGKVYRSKGYEIPEYGRTAKGIPIINLLGVGAGEKIQTVINVHEGENDDRYLFFVTQKGVVKRTPVKEFANIRSNGLIALNLKDEDELNNVILTSGQDNILIGTHLGYSVTFKEQDVRSMGRSATGVRGIRLREHDYVVGSDILKPDSEVFVISEKGYGKRTAAKEYPIKGRGGKGIKTANITAKNGPLAGVTTVDGTEDILVMTDSGVMIRFNIQSVSQTGRATLGVRLIRVDDDAKVATMAKVEPESDDPDDGSKPDQPTSPTDGSAAPTSQQPADGSYAGDADQQVSQLLDRAEADQPEQHDTGDQPE
ncbi:DNA gyrase subunit A [Lacticaseibacillus paracasei]|jgi:DNA gyrase subunit A|uniref:DNA gyrase subunit A n=2 Tax=Lacticaseibacillus paracasei TaxID=1597 RepID=Q03D50_LACP3|nr:DNA gyrase subunit A [Lacticaseibacillus paracasei]EPC68728.1 DNA gyrase subunit A [Lacticaseibacillus paracasei subsp. paracasei Lpp14]KRK16388.1 DNA gyrase, A subunit [Lacticaseibacillus casei DSM 20011 = JCM 1134 = ATCC 393]ABJ68872.1 DNA gyrase subunit A [Lacticaseibacillus paracasei ATCC 334]MDN5590482.1 DNA gyrase subunit A [Lacticaseibacillus paracasei]OSY80496.1 DNA gyrase subunit A [Lacticaseibacillus paracasei]